MIALIGDYDPAVTAHQAIPRALELAGTAAGSPVRWQWIGTADITDAPRQLAPFSGLWVVPKSPYRNMAGTLDAIRFARETGRPLLGTCGGFQHMLIEFARNVLEIADADHAETATTGTLVVTRLSCSLVEQTGALRFVSDSRIRAAYGTDTATEGYRCNYGPAGTHRSRFETAGLRFTAFDEAGEIRAAELPSHPFFVGTLFQPERAALRGVPPPLAAAFVRAVLERDRR
jgi:CTP synthase (UTP-ammonia lyase)